MVWELNYIICGVGITLCDFGITLCGFRVKLRYVVLEIHFVVSGFGVPELFFQVLSFPIW